MVYTPYRGIRTIGVWLSLIYIQECVLLKGRFRFGSGACKVETVVKDLLAWVLLMGCSL